jgi:hypothetical protein
MLTETETDGSLTPLIVKEKHKTSKNSAANNDDDDYADDSAQDDDEDDEVFLTKEPTKKKSKPSPSVYKSTLSIKKSSKSSPAISSQCGGASSKETERAALKNKTNAATGMGRSLSVGSTATSSGVHDLETVAWDRGKNQDSDAESNASFNMSTRAADTQTKLSKKSQSQQFNHHFTRERKENTTVESSPELDDSMTLDEMARTQSNKKKPSQ